MAVPLPTDAPSSMTAKGPMKTSLPIFAFFETTAVGWTPGFCRRVYFRGDKLEYFRESELGIFYLDGAFSGNRCFLGYEQQSRPRFGKLI